MLEWLRRMLGTGSGGRDSGAAAPGKFAGDFAFFSRKGRTLLPQILEYLAAGEDESVLGQLAGLPAGTGNDFQLMCCQPNWRANLHKRRQQVLRAMAGASPLLHVRAAKAYEAISQRDRKHL